MALGATSAADRRNDAADAAARGAPAASPTVPAGPGTDQRDHEGKVGHERFRSKGWRPHAIGVGLGVLVVIALIGHARLVHELQTVSSREFVIWPQRVVWMLGFLWGVVLLVVARFAPRLPAMPTVVALVLLYGAFASLPLLSRPLPLIGPWQPRMGTVLGAETTYQWQGSVLILMAGAMTTAAIWGWWRHARDRRRRQPEARTDGPRAGQ